MIRRPPRSTLFPYTSSSDLDNSTPSSLSAMAAFKVIFALLFAFLFVSDGVQGFRAVSQQAESDEAGSIKNVSQQAESDETGQYIKDWCCHSHKTCQQCKDSESTWEACHALGCARRTSYINGYCDVYGPRRTRCS